MRVERAILPLILTVIVVWALNRPLGSLPALGRLLDPVNGCWANAEPVNKDFSASLKLPSLKQPATVWFDAQLVPHIHAANDHDIYFIEGYLHAYFRLWQMDMETRAAAGRVSEVAGSKALKFDQTQRRKGMVYAAENSLRAMEAEPHTKLMLDAYTAGVNQFIDQLNYRNYPLEYKLMGFVPEQWTNLKSALLLKYMADDLTGYTEDIAQTVLRDLLTPQEFTYLYPEKISTSDPVIPRGTAFGKTSLSTVPVPADTNLFAHLHATDFEKEQNEGKGSNNWALSGSKTQSGAAILCNDPHLGLNLPSLWYQVQLQTPDMNVYGVSLPGAPGVVIGFNDSISWGFTNNYRDVKDFYAIESQDNNTYLFNGNQAPFKKRIEIIKVKGAHDLIDTVLYTVQGPVMYDEHFHGPNGLKKKLAMCWMAHRPTNELYSLYLLNRSKSYNDFVAAIHHFECPGQNMIYADRGGNIAIWGQGQFINKWKDQGRFVMEGIDSATMWHQLIPMDENPHALNPPQGYLASANESVTDSTYPYWYNGYFYEFRAWRINQVLRGVQHATVQDMFRLQNDTYSILAANALPVMLQHVVVADVGADAKKYFESLSKWNYYLSPGSKDASVFQLWWGAFYAALWKQRFANIPDNIWPSPERTMQLLKTDTALTNQLNPIATSTFNAAIDTLKKIGSGEKQEWYYVKNTSVKHLTKLKPFSYDFLKIGGWGNTVNAAKDNHGPSWRMVVEMGKEINAYGIYPGGQSGNPGSKYYATFLDKWVTGNYNKLLFLMNNNTQQSSNIKYTMTLQPK